MTWRETYLGTGVLRQWTCQGVFKFHTDRDAGRTTTFANCPRTLLVSERVWTLYRVWDEEGNVEPPPDLLCERCENRYRVSGAMRLYFWHQEADDHERKNAVRVVA